MHGCQHADLQASSGKWRWQLFHQPTTPAVGGGASGRDQPDPGRDFFLCHTDHSDHGHERSTRAYLASFQSNASRPFWRGYLKAYNLVNGTIPVDSVTGLPSGTPVWDAGQQLSLKTASSRTIKTYASSALQNFTTSNSAITTALLGAASSTEKDQIINYIRGAVDYNDEDLDSNTSEERPWKLGDIFHSTPVLVPPPFLTLDGFDLQYLQNHQREPYDDLAGRSQRWNASCVSRERRRGAVGLHSAEPARSIKELESSHRKP